MSDRNPATDPVDKAYLEAEAFLDEETARAARRARVLAAVALQQAEPTPEPAPARPKSPWRRGGWLAAASLTLFCAFLAGRLYQPAGQRLQPPPASVAATAAQSAPPEADLQTKPIAQRPGPARRPSVAAASPAPAAPTPELRAAPAPAAYADRSEILAPPPPAPPPPPPPPPPPQFAARAAAPAANASVGEVVVTGSRIARRDFEDAEPIVAAPGSPEEGAELLLQAAAAGRTTDIRRLLSQGVPVDAADAEGMTPLMKSIQAGRTEAAALLHRRGANLDLRNCAGVSARDMARDRRNPVLDEALGMDGDGSPEPPLGSR